MAGSRGFWEGRYRAAAEQRASLWGAAPNGWVAEQVERLGLPAGRAIDLGAGEGRNAFWLAERGWHVEAVDFAAAAVDAMQAEAGRRSLDVVAAVGDATSWSPAQPADLTVLCYLQLEPEALAAAIATAAAALRPGGVLLGIWHDRDDVARGLAGAMSPAIRTTPAETNGFAREAGLIVELSGRRDRAVQDGLACDCLLVARR